eukprot:ctg_1008.g419
MSARCFVPCLAAPVAIDCTCPRHGATQQQIAHRRGHRGGHRSRRAAAGWRRCGSEFPPQGRSDAGDVGRRSAARVGRAPQSRRHRSGRGSGRGHVAAVTGGEEISQGALQAGTETGVRRAANGGDPGRQGALLRLATGRVPQLGVGHVRPFRRAQGRRRGAGYCQPVRSAAVVRGGGRGRRRLRRAVCGAALARGHRAG